MSFAIDHGIEKKQLETSQREAILASGKNILVNAGAGSGKTFTILAKILHILDQNLAKPEEIIVVAYNTNVAIDLRDRLENLAKTFPNLENKIKRVSIDKYKICPECDEKIVQALHFCVKKKKYISRQIHTFHSYCYDLLKQNEKPQIAKYLEESEQKLQELSKAKFLEKIVEEIGSKDNSFFEKINKFFLNYIQHYKNIFKDINNMADYNRAIKPRHVALKIIDKDDEQIPLSVKSVEELEIANFLYLKGIEFVYEDIYQGKLPPQWERWDGDNSRGYRPDFHLIKKDKNGNIVYDEYYEHFALDKNLNPPSYFRDREKYVNDYRIKKSIFNGKLIETYSYQKIDGTLFEELTKQLVSKGIKVPKKNIISDKEALKKFKEAGYFDSFAYLVGNFLTNFKLRGADLKKLKSQFSSNWFKKLFENQADKRARAFIEIFEIIFIHYQKKLEIENRVDFEDMLLKGKFYIQNENIKYLIVDEFQDISPLRAEVLKIIKNHNKDVQLFVVGDDWQAIYGFSGGDISIIVKNFEKFFGKRNKKDLELTYRFNQKLCELTSSFIQKNSNQLKKNIKGIIEYDDVPVQIFKQKNKSNFEIDFSLKRNLLENLDHIFRSDPNVKKILFLTRYKDFNYKNGYEDLKKYLYNIFKSKRKNIEFLTIHSAKGSEADYVFILNISDGFLGFPSTIEDDPLLKLAKYDSDKKSDDKEEKNEEERRLFYVALTRTKKKVFIYGSEDAYFINEILNDKNIKKDYHYNVSNIKELSDPDKVVVINYVKGKKDEFNKNTPAKNIGMEAGDCIVKVESKKNPSKKEFDIELKNSKGKEVKIQIKKTDDNIENNEIRPFNINDETKTKKRWDIGATYFEREIDPFVESLINQYNVPLKDTKKNVR